MANVENRISRKEFDVCPDRALEEETLDISKHYRIEEALDEAERAREYDAEAES